MCLTPINLKKETFTQKLRDTYHMQQVPCGRCLECLKARVNSWFIRLLNEKNNSSTAWFITLTYDDNNLSFDSDFNSTFCIVTGKQIGRASCRERVSSPV